MLISTASRYHQYIVLKMGRQKLVSNLDKERRTIAHLEEVVEALLAVLHAAIDHAYLDVPACVETRHPDFLVPGHVTQLPVVPVQDVRIVEGHNEDLCIQRGAHHVDMMVSHPVSFLQTEILRGKQ